MERFAKRKVTILKGRSGQKLAFWCPDYGDKEFIGEYSQYMDNDSICEDVKYKLAKRKLSSIYGRSVSKYGREENKAVYADTDSIYT